MVAYIIRRILISIPVLFGITVITFLIVHLTPGSPIPITLDPKVMKPEVIARWEKNFHLDKPYVLQYAYWVRDLTTGRLTSFKDGQNVLKKILLRLRYTILLNIAEILIIFSLAIPLGTFSAVRRYSLADHILTFLCFVGISFPSFLLAYILIFFVSGILNVPVLGAETFGLEGLPPIPYAADRIWHLALPSIVGAVGGIAALSRYMRGSMLEVLQQDYVRTARAKGIHEDNVIYKHALKNALLPFITIFGFLVPSLIGGSVIIESIFAWPGIGRMSYEAVMSRDYPVIMTLTTISAFLVLLGNLIADILYAVVDPRIRYS
ncbi:MAG: ABC transporter permease [Planctomycetota bacterium]